MNAKNQVDDMMEKVNGGRKGETSEWRRERNWSGKAKGDWRREKKLRKNRRGDWRKKGEVSLEILKKVKEEKLAWKVGKGKWGESNQHGKLKTTTTWVWNDEEDEWKIIEILESLLGKWKGQNTLAEEKTKQLTRNWRKWQVNTGTQEQVCQGEGSLKIEKNICKTAN